MVLDREGDRQCGIRIQLNPAASSDEMWPAVAVGQMEIIAAESVNLKHKEAKNFEARWPAAVADDFFLRIHLKTRIHRVRNGRWSACDVFVA